jgi:hypothetical protein
MTPETWTANGNGTPCWEWFHNRTPACSLCDLPIKPGEAWLDCDGWAEHVGCCAADSEASASSSPPEDPHRAGVIAAPPAPTPTDHEEQTA